jgi:hypothetical protein
MTSTTCATSSNFDALHSSRPIFLTELQLLVYPESHNPPTCVMQTEQQECSTR